MSDFDYMVNLFETAIVNAIGWAEWNSYSDKKKHDMIMACAKVTLKVFDKIESME